MNRRNRFAPLSRLPFVGLALALLAVLGLAVGQAIAPPTASAQAQEQSLNPENFQVTVNNVRSVTLDWDAGNYDQNVYGVSEYEIQSLDGNSIGGSLPAELGNLSNLTRLALNRNSLTGSIPSGLGSLSNLSIIGLARNSLSGTLPTSLGNLSGLTKLSLHDNTGLSGALPSGFTNLANLQRLAIANTGLCAPDDEAFSDWLDTVSDKPGGVPTCE